MSYQLVLQFQVDSINGYDGLLVLEEDLIDVLGDSAEVDGHDIGSGEANIFIITATPETTFRRAKLVLEQRGLLAVAAAAYRPVAADNYTRVWPEHSSKPFTVA